MTSKAAFFQVGTIPFTRFSSESPIYNVTGNQEVPPIAGEDIRTDLTLTADKVKKAHNRKEDDPDLTEDDIRAHNEQAVADLSVEDLRTHNKQTVTGMSKKNIKARNLKATNPDLPKSSNKEYIPQILFATSFKPVSSETPPCYSDNSSLSKNYMKKDPVFHCLFELEMQIRKHEQQERRKTKVKQKISPIPSTLVKPFNEAKENRKLIETNSITYFPSN